ncbi:hypothetical protein [Aneurinibacillus tyrosinisolvens]|uniref:hypothetical protein n=1 Tax=Aneurinibacillus tyrosinisolvens TaxID=1443435 RepID=UPI00128B6258|nr:hypothetical protein [Aneurinibacillus tyrosinisolvens]
MRSKETEGEQEKMKMKYRKMFILFVSALLLLTAQAGPARAAEPAWHELAGAATYTIKADRPDSGFS